MIIVVVLNPHLEQAKVDRLEEVSFPGEKDSPADLRGG